MKPTTLKSILDFAWL